MIDKVLKECGIEYPDAWEYRPGMHLFLRDQRRACLSAVARMHSRIRTVGSTLAFCIGA